MAEDINQTQSETLEQRLKDVEKGHVHTEDKLNWGLDLLKWGLGIFATIALAFAGGNAWLAKSNYDRDEKALIERVAFLKEQLSAANASQMADLRRQTETSILSISNSMLSFSNSLQYAFRALETDVYGRISNAWLSIATNILATNISIMHTIASNNDARYYEVVTNLNKAMSSNRVTLDKELNEVLASTRTNVDVSLAHSMGLALMLQANMISKKLEGSKAIRDASAADSYIQACHLLYKGRDEQNLQRCLQTLHGDCLPKLIVGNSKKSLQILASRYGLSSQLKGLISELEAGDEHQRYADSIAQLKYYQEFLEGRLSAR